MYDIHTIKAKGMHEEGVPSNPKKKTKPRNREEDGMLLNKKS
jgi:hypothetical protein